MNRLHVRSLVSVGAVEEGDNPEAEILFYKRREPEPGRIEKEGASMPEAFDPSSLPEDAQEYITAQIAAGITAASEGEGDSPALPDDLPDVVKARFDEQAEAIEKERVEKEALAERVDELLKERADEKYTTICKDYATLLGDDAKDTLQTLGEAAPEAFADLMKRLTTLKNLDSVSKVLTEIGGSANEAGSAADQITAIAKEKMDKNPDLTYADARAQAWAENPDLTRLAREGG